MDPLSLTGTLIAVLQITGSIISTCYDYRQSVASFSRDAVQMTESLSALRDVLESLLRLVECSKSDDAGSFPTIEMLAKEGGALEGCTSELERLKTKLEPEIGWRKLKSSLMWPLKEAEMKKSLEALERFKSTLQLALSTDQTKLSLEIRGDVQYLSKMFQKQSLDQKHQNLFRWLDAPSPHTSHVVHRKKCLRKTGTWFLTSSQYENWLLSPNSFLWLYGIPGSGKTVLCSTIIEHVIRHCQLAPGTAVVYFYFELDNSGKRLFNSLLRSIMTQLASQTQDIPQALINLYESQYNSTKTIEDSESIAVISNFVSTYKNVYFILDALDEASDYEEILQLIEIICSWSLPQTHLLATSRQLSEIEETLSNLITDRICLQDSVRNEDIYWFVKDKLKNDKKLSKWPAGIREQIENSLLEGEDGMFQWVVCQFDMLQRCMSVAAVRKVLQAGFPRNLEQTYDQILSRIDENYQTQVKTILQVLTVCVESFTLDEIVEILAVDLESSPPCFDPDSRLLDPQNIFYMCSSLTTILLFRGKSDTYLHAEASPCKKSTSFHFTRTSARQVLARIFLAYLLNPAFENVLGDNILEEPRTDSSLYPLSTAAKLWPKWPFLRQCPDWPLYLKKHHDDPEEFLEPSTLELVRTFFATSKLPNGGNFIFWVHTLAPEVPVSQLSATHPIYYASSFGLTEVVCLLLETEKELDIDAFGGKACSTALHVAVYRDHFEIAKMLLEHGANPNLVNKSEEHQEVPIYYAILTGNNKMRDLLLKYGAEVPMTEAPGSQGFLDEALFAHEFEQIERDENSK